MIKQKKQKEVKESIVTVVGEGIPVMTVTPFVKRVQFTSFEEWWSNKRAVMGLRDSLRDAVKRHFEIRGFMASGRFDEGLTDFGIKS